MKWKRARKGNRKEERGKEGQTLPCRSLKGCGGEGGVSGGQANEFRATAACEAYKCTSVTRSRLWRCQSRCWPLPLLSHFLFRPRRRGQLSSILDPAVTFPPAPPRDILTSSQSCIINKRRWAQEVSPRTSALHRGIISISQLLTKFFLPKKKKDYLNFFK